MKHNMFCLCTKFYMQLSITRENVPINKFVEDTIKWTQA